MNTMNGVGISRKNGYVCAIVYLQGLLCLKGLLLEAVLVGTSGGDYSPSDGLTFALAGHFS